jgi:hypothetical protein
LCGERPRSGASFTLGIACIACIACIALVPQAEPIQRPEESVLQPNHDPRHAASLRLSVAPMMDWTDEN